MQCINMEGKVTSAKEQMVLQLLYNLGHNQTDHRPIILETGIKVQLDSV